MYRLYILLEKITYADGALEGALSSGWKSSQRLLCREIQQMSQRHHFGHHIFTTDSEIGKRLMRGDIPLDAVDIYA